ncbi:MAG TPA: phosphate acyltransferase PlsX [Hyphomonadaceae bacterium]|nr:phosphate acyltransferase PlsX [Hyphomonadaceae bacterium]HPI49887.1 phosphate acyltransferase PlsX [Hyphomonadaceae bacterium]
MANGKIISIDGMGGDHAPRIVVEGLERFAQRRRDLNFLLHGDETQLAPLMAKAPTAAASTTIRHTDKMISMDAKPADAVRRGKGSSMWNAIESVKNGEAMAAVSAGNTGALMGQSMLILKKAEGVERPALAASWPTRTGVCAMLDLGADIAATAEQLVEFAIMGQAFARVVNGVANPRVALLNIGSEELKGHESIREAARLIRGSNLQMDFRGYIEADKIGFGEVDVVVADGFTGNVALKTAEGIAKMMSDMLKEAFKSGPLATLGALLAMPALKKFSARLDPRKVNGAVFLGLNGVVVKSHGGTDAVGFEQAISVAAGMGESHFRSEVEENLKRLVASASAAAPAAVTSEQAAK